MAVDLSVNLAGLELKNPIIIAAGNHTHDGETMATVAPFGPAAAVTKTIVAEPVPDVLPCFAQVNGGFISLLRGYLDSFPAHDVPARRMTPS